ncbi:Plexin-A2 [Araneus ventricosus]|uniref:Plexin-A2 n=1 Tax=Araneus ventricosus TaxID=182803 RepID=A0A4Y2HTK0_ARAVE|nr:Plexin-A2 [Araneus ventricosus]
MRFLCQFNIEGRVKQVNAQLIGEIMYCEEMVFSYSTQAPNFTAAFAVIWDVNKTFDNPENIHVLIFRCSGMAQSCGVCLELPEKYKCGWCQDTDNSCQVYEHCNRLPTLWLDRRQTCPNPQILSFTPKSGPWEGGTNITIGGINLGRVFQDIANNIRVIHEGLKVHKNGHERTDILSPRRPLRLATRLAPTALFRGPLTEWHEMNAFP